MRPEECARASASAAQNPRVAMQFPTDILRKYGSWAYKVSLQLRRQGLQDIRWGEAETEGAGNNGWTHA
jgi:hypothetical protein